MVINKLKGIYSSLTKSEKKAADYIIERPDDTIHYSITELSKWSGVSETTVYRLVRKAGFDGYQQFKLELVREMSSESTIEKSSNVYESYFNKTISTINTIYKNLDIDTINEIIDRILISNRLIFFAVGRSAPIAEDIAIKFSSLGYSAVAYSDPHIQVMVSASLTSNDTVFTISHSGFIRDTYKSTEIANDAGAYTIGITSGVNSPLSKIVKKALYTVASPHENEFIESRIGEVFLMDILYNAMLMKKNHNKHFEELSKVIRPKRF
ncbi:RpiR family transcriptional regulator [Tepiditoga spiralis]|uniref:RpiR family transcriptional regulator n=1 Tax=Tepiditoga spiralis TaxID=2108365 RepID=A0A7G1GA67_9BACT|nr:MurR/RpiR family transcriptional regulator [Tepiditoga spiralis]BBE30299.1 RpiR family transcriptional regulator [Tepiditoga spiralis]